MTTTILPDDRCPTCGYVLDACTGLPSNQSDRPSPGDIALCFGCGEVLFFTAEMKHAVYPKAKLPQLDPELILVIHVGQAQIRSRRLPRTIARA